MSNREMWSELVDLITDWVSENVPERVCSSCCDNVPERDVNYSYCKEADYDMFQCPYAQGDLSMAVQEAAQHVIDALPNPPVEEFFSYPEY